VDYGELKNARRDESVIFSMQTFVVKLASGIAAFVASICLQITGISDVEDAVAAAAEAVGQSVDEYQVIYSDWCSPPPRWGCA
jgi:melibiose permease